MGQKVNPIAIRLGINKKVYPVGTLIKKTMLKQYILIIK